MNERTLVIDDEANMRWVLSEALKGAGFDVRAVATGSEAFSLMTQWPAQLVILDLKLKGMDGLATLRRLRERWPDTVVIMLTAYGTVATAVEAMQLGAVDYLRKPFDVEELIFKIQRALERKALHTEIERLRHLMGETYVADPVGSHPLWRRALDQVRSLTRLTSTFVLVGETGVGKTLLARWSHQLSSQANAPLIEIDASSFAATQFMTMLKGSTHNEGGKALVGSGTLLIRHLDQFSLAERQYISSLLFEHGKPPMRVIITSQVSLSTDPWFSDFPEVHVPPLREHAEDIVHLVQGFLPHIALTPTALHLLERFNWSGNITELRHVIERAVRLAQNQANYQNHSYHTLTIEERHLPERVRQAPDPDSPIRLPLEGIHLETMEMSLLRQALERTGGNKTRAAELLGLTRHTFIYRLEKYGIGMIDPGERKEGSSFN